MPVSTDLWAANADLAEACRRHRFVQQLAEGTLPSVAFRCYVGQDAFFLQSFARAYALAAAKCEDWEQMPHFHHLLGGVLDELKLHKRYAESLGLNLSDVRPLATTRAYTDFLLATSWAASTGEILAAMVPCMKLYAYLGQQLAGANHAKHPYGDWISTYSSEGFQELTAEIESLLDGVARPSPAVSENYRHAMLCELAFFSAPLEATTPEVHP